MVPDEEEVEWLKENYPKTSNNECAKRLGVCEETIRRIAKDYGIEKHCHDDLPNEEWRSVIGWEELYEASNMGRIRSLNYKSSGKTKVLRPSTNPSGYDIVVLQNNGYKTTKTVHRIVYEAFNGHIPEGLEVNHINECKTDNRIENLNLMTREENLRYGTGIERRASKIRGIKRSEETKRRMSLASSKKPILQFTREGEFIREWMSQKEAYTTYNFHSFKMWQALTGKCQTAGGFIWKYKEENN